MSQCWASFPVFDLERPRDIVFRQKKSAEKERCKPRTDEGENSKERVDKGYTQSLYAK
jgi:hypothetical protein